jgi:hypothetical protein
MCSPKWILDMPVISIHQMTINELQQYPDIEVIADTNPIPQSQKSRGIPQTRALTGQEIRRMNEITPWLHQLPRTPCLTPCLPSAHCDLQAPQAT